VLCAICLLAKGVEASRGDRLPEFRNCVDVSWIASTLPGRTETDVLQVCKRENCAKGSVEIRT
jgi:hypothetical protein